MAVAIAHASLQAQASSEDNPIRLARIPVGSSSAKSALGIEELLLRYEGEVSTLGLVGMGRVGQLLGKQARDRFSFKVIYHDWQPIPEAGALFDAHFATLEAIFQQADLVCIALPLIGDPKALLMGGTLPDIAGCGLYIGWLHCEAVSRAIAYLSRHYARLVPLQELAATARLGRFQLARQFSSTLGVAPRRYQLLLRVAHAKTMLCHGIGAGEVASRLGFADQSHFGRCFRSVTGMTPRQFKQTH